MSRIAYACLTLLVLLTLPWSWARAQDQISAGVKLPAHPRILLLGNGEKAIQQAITVDKTWRELHQAILGECDRLLTVPPVERTQTGRRLLDKSREALRRLYFLAYAWRMTRQRPYLERAEKELLAISAFSDWNPSHFLDVAEMTMAAGIGYDWLYNDLSANSRTSIREAILRKGIEPSLDIRYNTWLKATHNWNQVCNAGMAYGALAIYEDQPDLARTILNRAIETIVLPMQDYAPDGAYPEGYSYWGYGTSFNVLFISALEQAFGHDFGLAQQPGFLKTASYLANMTGPSGNSFNYSDAGTGGELQPAMFWFANRLKDPSLLWGERSRLLTSPVEKHLRDRLLPSVMLWHGGSRVGAIQPPTKTIWVGGGKSPVALMRTSWTDPGAVFVGLKGGSPSVNHAHMDVGSFVLEADGVRWGVDLGMQDYNSLETKGVDLWNRAQNSQRWQVYRYRNQVHNTLTVNDELQKVDGNAQITRWSDAPQFTHAITDLTSLYGGELTKAHRGIAIVNASRFVVRDELTAAAKPATVRWTLLTMANVVISGNNRAELTRDGKKLIVQVQEPALVTMRAAPAEPTHDYDAPNPGATLLMVEITLPAQSSGALTVWLTPEKADGKLRPSVPPLHKWP